MKRVLRHISDSYCRELLKLTSISKVDRVIAHEPEFITTIDLSEVVASLNKRQRQMFNDFTRRIDHMTDDVGQEILARLVCDKTTYAVQSGPYNQSTWVFLHEQSVFEQAESERFADEARLTAKWDSFKVLSSVDQLPDLDQLKKYLVQHFGGDDEVLVELFERERPCIDGTIEALQQVMVYREGLPSLLKEVSREKKTLRETMVKPAREYAFLWNPKKGELEVVTRRKQEREQLAELFTSNGLGIEQAPEKLEKRQLTLDVLKSEKPLPFNREEGIEQVSVAALKFRSTQTDATYTVHSPARKAHEMNVYQVMREDQQDSLLHSEHYIVVEASIAVKFRKKEGQSRANSTTIHLKTPCSSNLQELTERERYLSWNKLKEWGLTHD
ncbi:hypothetical protein NX722_03860 [Endozoicomonas gorgoniicola]|uniref:Uncharacterized protein n=1 Tax=Endozoicomonas gorgoniicola TaxID=1234144 RepID=A0ABT3MR12_9GAMM|nr:hypothetical protein [Endozoicomonas gorgoniicola]MCW7551787.1 hypothetical protein [Endozoicomonas gorgoniicola]